MEILKRKRIRVEGKEGVQGLSAGFYFVLDFLPVDVTLFSVPVRLEGKEVQLGWTKVPSVAIVELVVARLTSAEETDPFIMTRMEEMLRPLVEAEVAANNGVLGWTDLPEEQKNATQSA